MFIVHVNHSFAVGYAKEADGGFSPGGETVKGKLVDLLSAVRMLLRSTSFPVGIAAGSLFIHPLSF